MLLLLFVPPDWVVSGSLGLKTAYYSEITGNNSIEYRDVVYDSDDDEEWEDDS